MYSNDEILELQKYYEKFISIIKEYAIRRFMVDRKWYLEFEEPDIEPEVEKFEIIKSSVRVTLRVFDWDTDYDERRIFDFPLSDLSKNQDKLMEDLSDASEKANIKETTEYYKQLEQEKKRE